ncbi:hypothetical protein B0H65DRAFT_541695, partial [Neurospora tetraspora]
MARSSPVTVQANHPIHPPISCTTCLFLWGRRSYWAAWAPPLLILYSLVSRLVWTLVAVPMPRLVNQDCPLSLPPIRPPTGPTPTCQAPRHRTSPHNPTPPRPWRPAPVPSPAGPSPAASPLESKPPCPSRSRSGPCTAVVPALAAPDPN